MIELSALAFSYLIINYCKKTKQNKQNQRKKTQTNQLEIKDMNRGKHIFCLFKTKQPKYFKVLKLTVDLSLLKVK